MRDFVFFLVIWRDIFSIISQAPSVTAMPCHLPLGWRQGLCGHRATFRSIFGGGGVAILDVFRAVFTRRRVQKWAFLGVGGGFSRFWGNFRRRRFFGRSRLFSAKCESPLRYEDGHWAVGGLFSSADWTFQLICHRKTRFPCVKGAVNEVDWGLFLCQFLLAPSLIY